MQSGQASTAAIGRAAQPSLVPGLVLGLLLFLGSADSVFATRLAGMNFRWGQGLLLLLAALALPRAWRSVRDRLAERETQLLAGSWALFFVAYLVSSMLSPAPGLSFVKLSWALFNIGGAALAILSGTQRRETLVTGLVTGSLLVSGVIWIDALAIYWAGLQTPLLGLAQHSYRFEGAYQVRPHAFYYEPSYAGSTLAFAVPLLFAATHALHKRRFLGLLAPAAAMSAVVLTSARTGVLGLVVGLVVAGGLALRRGDGATLGRMGRSGLLALAMLAVFFAATPKSQQYGRFILGPLGPKGIYQRLTSKPKVAQAEEPKPVPQVDVAVQQPAGSAPASAPAPAKVDTQTSEGARVANITDTLRRWRERLVFGWGAAPAPSMQEATGQLLPPATMNTWLEIALESGLFGIAAFVVALALTLRGALRRLSDPQVGLFVAAAVTTHLVCNLNLTQTFPRLDYWLLFFAALRLALPDEPSAQPQRTPVQPLAPPAPVPSSAAGLADARAHLAPAAEAGRSLP